ncbi:glycosyltransferase [Alkalihalobacterium chitinilyticum]|uniref:Glycosyltransferase n=1 Tax=Alkalihalobacterium chitinilyticum TaxID=2980103 RepID=A0ABT5VBM8_9BACI|nr:glycosyltransferase [Alkalihalobacterium chitinilyticum]MDE5412680.1 glycosyltransferase [Alkalihalobacterium chitinilyticum]
MLEFLRFSGKESIVIDPLIKEVKNSFTYEFWVKPLTEHKNSIQTFIKNSGMTGQNYVIGPVHGGTHSIAGAGISVGKNGVTVFEHTHNYLPATLVYDGEIHKWTHVAVVYKDKRPFLYINGKLVKSGLKSLKNEVYASGIIGGLQPYGYFNGLLGELRIWSYPRSQYEINKDMNKSITGEVQGLYGCWSISGNDFIEVGRSKTKSHDIKLVKEDIQISQAAKSVMKQTDVETIDVIVCVHNALADVMECLESLMVKKTIPFNLIIVDDGSDNATKSYLKHFANKYNVQLVRNRVAQGYTKAANKGLKLSRSNYSVLLNSDTIVTQHWLEKLIQCMESEKHVGIVGPVSNAATWQSVPKVTDGTGWATNPLDLTVEEQSRIVEKASTKSYPEVPLLNGFCLMIKRDVLNRIGYFDEVNFEHGYGEENDFCLRATSAGFKLKVSENCFIYHKKSKSYTEAKKSILKKRANNSLNKKFSLEEIKKATDALKLNEKLQLLRSNVLQGINKKIPENNNPLVLFVLPVKGGNGGVHSIIQETIGLQKININAKIAIKGKLKKEYLENYPEAKDYFLYFKDEEELIRISQHFDIVVATIFSSVSLVKNIIDKYPYIKSAYYIQDYEPWFFTTDHPSYLQAIESYELLPNIYAYAKTNWICNIVKKNHGLNVHKIQPSLDQSLFNSGFERVVDNKQVRISAMVRPKTPRRSPKETVEVLKEIKEMYGDKVEISTFGCTNDELKKLEDSDRSLFKNYGVLKRHQVATLLKGTDIFIDLSSYQAFGRTGLEAMAVGCCVILPVIGGTDEYAVHNENSYLVNVQHREKVIEYICRLIDDHEIRQYFSQKAIRSARRYSIEEAAISAANFFLEIVRSESH